MERTKQILIYFFIVIFDSCPINLRSDQNFLNTLMQLYSKIDIDPGKEKKMFEMSFLIIISGIAKI